MHTFRNFVISFGDRHGNKLIKYDSIIYSRAYKDNGDYFTHIVGVQVLKPKVKCTSKLKRKSKQVFINTEQYQQICPKEEVFWLEKSSAFMNFFYLLSK